MKLDARTVQILKNFASINGQMLFRPGNVISTIAASKSVFARANVSESIEREFGIYDLSRFLGTISVFNNPELALEDRYMTIKEGKRKINYTFTEPALLLAPPDKTIDMGDLIAEFQLSAEALQELMRASSILGLEYIVIQGDGTNISIELADVKNSTSDTYKVDLDPTDKEFRMVFKTEYFKFLSAVYTVQCSTEKGVVRFKSDDIEYFVAQEAR
jgi:hypothetical protein